MINYLFNNEKRRKYMKVLICIFNFILIKHYWNNILLFLNI